MLALIIIAYIAHPDVRHLEEFVSQQETVASLVIIIVLWQHIEFGEDLRVTHTKSGRSNGLNGSWINVRVVFGIAIVF